MKKRFWIGYILLLAASFASAQDIKSTPASDALVKAAKEATEAEKSFNDLMQQARTGLTETQKTTSQKIKTDNQKLWDDVKQDKKYKARIDDLDRMQKQLDEAATNAQKDFNAKSMPLQQTIASDAALIAGLAPVVLADSNLPDTTTTFTYGGITFTKDAKTQKWTVPAETKK